MIVGTSAFLGTAALAAGCAGEDTKPTPNADTTKPIVPEADTIRGGPLGIPTAEQPGPGASITAVRGSRMTGWSGQSRSEIVARRGVVATSQPLAAQAGLKILQEGGNSADAAIATAAVLGVVEPNSAGIGGDSFAIHYDAKSRKLYGLTSAGWSPQAWSVDYFRQRGFTPNTGFPLVGIDTVTVPGAVDGWDQLLKRFGSRGFDVALAPAVEIAEEGFGVTELIRSQWADRAEVLAKDPDSTKTFLRDGSAPPLYSVVRNPDLARAYRAIQSGGRDAFYTGEIAQAILAKSQSLGGSLTAEDLSGYRGEWVDTISSPHQDFDVHQLPPPNQGFGMLLMLNILGQVPQALGKDLVEIGPHDPQYFHIAIEAKKLAYSELHRYNGDPKFNKPPMQKLLSADFARDLCKRINLDKATPPEVRGANPGDTVYLATADRFGNMTSFIYSIYDSFGSGLTVPNFGFPLHNRGALFNLDPASPNAVEGRKRPFHTLIPGFITHKDGPPAVAFGNMGGHQQAQAQAMEAFSMISLGYNPQAASDAARFYHNQWTDEVTLELELFNLAGDQLRSMGHKLTKPGSSSMGGFQAIAYTAEKAGDWPAQTAGDGPLNGVYRAASDHRKDGLAAGW